MKPTIADCRMATNSNGPWYMEGLPVPIHISTSKKSIAGTTQVKYDRRIVSVLNTRGLRALVYLDAEKGFMTIEVANVNLDKQDC